ncbi:hypothetical protein PAPPERLAPAPP_04020 [Brevundimonas phage vB_BpoS-Papperlapapp]|uniref:Uncharacterized protein n=2 Tax=Marchewkavirus TaxID=3425052 RepID=A0A9E7MQW6_9CAUD|nr:hypothetical protein KABACHOK_02400 [Brevundimonas phage vB_BpoS-Kabachok]USN14771.1 hypothetical protein DOMOVOI_02970 [Brevundimonas phage vB_BpoS-Domovoi]USN16143.1 hypothetical protein PAPPERLAPAPP_04020 [Brevundimonas phage vB_BpoS-Papperlapapp]
MDQTTIPPNNGTKTHPLSAHALGVLRALSRGAMPMQEINPGVSNRLRREDLITEESMVSPYKTHKGGKIAFAVITDAGRAAIAG